MKKVTLFGSSGSLVSMSGLRRFAAALLCTLAVVCAANPAQAQGTLVFNTRVVGVVDAPMAVFTVPSGPGPAFSAQLFLVGAGGSLTPIPGVTRIPGTGTHCWPAM